MIDDINKLDTNIGIVDIVSTHIANLTNEKEIELVKMIGESPESLAHAQIFLAVICKIIPPAYESFKRSMETFPLDDFILMTILNKNRPKN